MIYASLHNLDKTFLDHRLKAGRRLRNHLVQPHFTYEENEAQTIECNLPEFTEVMGG